MALTFVKELPKKGSGLAAQITDEMYDIADQCREHPNEWTTVARRTAKASVWYPLRQLDLRVEIRGVATEKYTIEKGPNKGQERDRTLYDVWVGHIVPIVVDGTKPAGDGAGQAGSGDSSPKGKGK